MSNFADVRSKSSGLGWLEILAAFFRHEGTDTRTRNVLISGTATTRVEAMTYFRRWSLERMVAGSTGHLRCTRFVEELTWIAVLR